MIEYQDRLDMSYAEGVDDGHKGNNYNPYDEDTQPDEFLAYETGFTHGLFDVGV